MINVTTTNMAVSRIIMILIVVFSVVCMKGIYGQGACQLLTPCSCQFANGQHIDLSPLAGTGGVPRFVNMTDAHQYDSFSWNPCYNFTEGPCKEVAVCQIRPAFPVDQYFTIGWQQTAQFAYNSKTDKLALTYNDVTNTLTGTAGTRSAVITLTCEQNGQTSLKVTGQKTQTSSIFFFELKSPHACAKGTPDHKSALSKTDIILISSLGGGVAILVVVILVVLKVKGKICKRQSYETLN